VGFENVYINQLLLCWAIRGNIVNWRCCISNNTAPVWFDSESELESGTIRRNGAMLKLQRKPSVAFLSYTVILLITAGKTTNCAQIPEGYV